MKQQVLLWLTLLPVCAVAANSLAEKAAKSQAAVVSTARGETITLGESVTDLTGPWRFQPGDSPMVNGAPVWAQPGFNDSQWALTSLAPEAGAIDLSTGQSSFVPGWTKRGYPDLSGYAWYRLRVKVKDPGEQLWLKMPQSFDDAYQVFANGKYAGQFGRFSEDGVQVYYERPFSFPLPPPSENGTIEIAVRFYMSPATPLTNPDSGGLHAPPALGLAGSVGMLQAADNDRALHLQFGPLLQVLLFLLVAPLAVWAWLRDRHDPTFLWLLLALGCTILVDLISGVASLSFAIPISAENLLDATILSSALGALWIVFWWSCFGRQRQWIFRAAWTAAGAQIMAYSVAFLPNFGLNLIPTPWLHYFNFAAVCCTVAEGILLALILMDGYRRDRAEGLLATVPVLLFECGRFSSYLLSTFDLPTNVFILKASFSTVWLAEMAMVLMVLVLALRRFVRTQIRQEVDRKAIANDLEQARQLQERVLVPEAFKSRFFTVEAVYRPAQTVGGDFFQTLSRPDGTLLVVIGDVSGKGVSAAMLVAVLVGAIRSYADYSFDPAAMLNMLNQRLLGRSEGHFASCMVAAISPVGDVRLANAGHLAPYRNGKEVEIGGSLPLGMSHEVDCSETWFSLLPGDHLTFLTDGVVEATNSDKQLFGFERTQAISRDDAALIVERVQLFGQGDDITVIAVEYVPEAVAA